MIRPRRHTRSTSCGWTVACLVFATAACTLAGPRVHSDDDGDAVARRTDPGADAPFDPATHRLIDLIEIRVGAFRPSDPTTDLFAGLYDGNGAFLRTDIVVRGLVNPPGPSGPDAFAPFVHGDHPIYGFVEFDVDREIETGGESDAPEFRYLGNVARFGGLPERSELEHRTARDASAFDGDILTEPQVERSGEEFHVALLGHEFWGATIDRVDADLDDLFEVGETWRLRGSFFHRAHGFEPFSLADGGAASGEYAPESVIQFRHDLVRDTTEISLVFPLTNAAAAVARDEVLQPNNADPSDHASIAEGLCDLQTSAEFLAFFPSGLPEEAMITGWRERVPTDFLEPEKWRVTALLGSTYTAPIWSGTHFVWTDIFPSVDVGDVNGDGLRNAEDRDAILQFIDANDAGDGLWDGTVVIGAFALDFSLFDVNYDGVVDGRDPDAADVDIDFDLRDAALFQRCVLRDILIEPVCGGVDIDGDSRVTLGDWPGFIRELDGPRHSNRGSGSQP